MSDNSEIGKIGQSLGESWNAKSVAEWATRMRVPLNQKTRSSTQGLAQEIARQQQDRERSDDSDETCGEGRRTGKAHVIIDTAPGFSELSVNVLFYVDEVVVPVSMEVLAVEGLVSLQEELAGIGKYSTVRIRAILPTFVDGRVGKTDTILAGLRETFGDLVTFPIHYSTRLSELPAHGQTIYEYEPSGRGCVEYAKVAGALS